MQKMVAFFAAAAFVGLAAFLPAVALAQEAGYYDGEDPGALPPVALAPPPEPYPDDDDWGDWLWEAEGLVLTEARAPRRLQDGPVAVEVISAEEIQNSTAVTLADVLADHGMLLGEYRAGNSEHQGGRVIMQGMDGGNVTFLINGRRVAGRQSDNIVEATLPLSNVERIEVIRGPQSVRHGSAVGGVINIITREPEEDRVTFSASFTNRFLLPHNDPDTVAEPSAGFDPAREQNLAAAVGFPIGRSRNAVDLEASRGSFHFDETGVHSILPRYTRGRLGFDSILSLTDDIDLRYGLSGMMLRTEHQTMVATGANAGSPNFINRRDYMRLDAHMGIDWFFSDEIEMSFDLTNSYYHREFDRFIFRTGTPPNLANDVGAGQLGEWRSETALGRDNITGLEMTGSWLFRPSLRFTGGIEGRVQVAQSERFPDDTIVWQNYEMFLEAEHFVTGRYSVALGVRGMHNPRFGPMAVPRVSGTVHLGNGFRLLAGGGMGYRTPNFVNLYSYLSTTGRVPNIGYGGAALGNPDLEPETSVGANLGFEWTGPRAFLHANFFHTELWNQIGTPSIANPSPGSPGHIPGLAPVIPGAPHGRFRTWVNLDRTFRTGVDAEARVNLPLHMFVTAGYSWVFGWDRTEGSEITLSPPHTIRGRLGINLPSPSISAHVNLRWAAGFTSRGADPPFSTSWDASLVETITNYAPPSEFESNFNMGIFAAYRLNENWRVNFGVDNLLPDVTNATGQNIRQTFSVGIVFTH